MADKGMPPFLKKKLGKGSADSESESESASDDATSSDAPATGTMSKSNPLAKWAAKKKG